MMFDSKMDAGAKPGRLSQQRKLSNVVFNAGDTVKKLSIAAGDNERYQLGTVERTTHDGLVVVKWHNGSVCNTYVSFDNLEKQYTV